MQAFRRLVVNGVVIDCLGAPPFKMALRKSVGGAHLDANTPVDINIETVAHHATSVRNPAALDFRCLFAVMVTQKGDFGLCKQR